MRFSIWGHFLLLLWTMVGAKPLVAETNSTLSPIVFQSDFGTQDDAVAIVKGVLFSIEPALNVVDLTHQVLAFAVQDAARFVANTSVHYPRGTVFLSLVDRHVPGSKKPIAVKSKKGQYFVQPDNGLITLVADRDGIEEVREISVSPWVSEKKIKSSFMWRDVYAPVAAHLARGEDFKTVGPVLGKSVRLDLRALRINTEGISGEIVALDGPFGNLITNITAASLLSAGYALGDMVTVNITGKKFKIPFVKTFDDVVVGNSLLYIDSTDHVAFAINQGNFAKKYKVKPAQQLQIAKQRKKE